MANEIDGILQATQSENPLFAEWGRPGNDSSVVIDRLLVNPDAIHELFTGDYSATGEDPQTAIQRWVTEINLLKGEGSTPSRSQRLKAFLSRSSLEPLITVEKERRFSLLREEFDDFVSQRISSLVNLEAAVSWLSVLAEELSSRKIETQAAVLKLDILLHYRDSLKQIALMDQLIIGQLQTMELRMDMAAAALAIELGTAKVLAAS